MFSLSPPVHARFTRLSHVLTYSLLCLWIALVQAQAAQAPLIDINTATPALLAEMLPGIGPAKAKAIVAYRELHGPFKTLDLLVEVKGIGPRTLTKIRPLIFVNNDGSQKSGAAGGGATGSLKPEKSQLQNDKAARNAVRAAVNIAKRYEAN